MEDPYFLIDWYMVSFTKYASPNSIGMYVYKTVSKTEVIDKFIEALLFNFELNAYCYTPDPNEYIGQKYYIMNLIKNDICYIEDNKLFLTDSTLLKLI